MDQVTDSQELARRFNEDEAVWQRHEYLRRLRIRLGIEALLPDEVLDELDWIDAERECRQAWFIGERLPCRAHIQKFRVSVLELGTDQLSHIPDSRMRDLTEANN